MGDRKVIDESDLSPALLTSDKEKSSRETGEAATFETSAADDVSSTVALDELERLTIQRVFEQVGGDKAKAGELLGISRATLYRKLKRYQISAASRGDKVPA
jgi:DNA-binding NtrC family response regulator